MGKVRIGIGLVLVIVGFILYTNLTYNHPLDLTKTVDPSTIESAIKTMFVVAVMIGSGAVILGWGIRSYTS